MSNELAVIHAAQEEIKNFPGKLVVESFAVGERNVANLYGRAKMHDCNFTIIDQLQFLDRPVGMPRNEQIEQLMLEIKGEVMEGMPTLMAAQFNRAAGDYNDNIGDVEDMGMSAAVEHLSDTILALGRTEEMSINETMFLKSIKSRNDQPRKWVLDWNLVHKAEFGIIGEAELN